MFANAIALLLGACAIHSLPALPEWQVWGPVCLCGWLLALLLRRFQLGWCAAWFLGGVLWAWGHASWRLAHDLPAELEGVDLEITGDVDSLPERTGSGLRFVLAVRKGPELTSAFPLKLELTWYDAPVTPGPGEHWQFTVRLRRRHGFANPGGFDYEAQLFREGIGATGYIREEGNNLRLAEADLTSAVSQMRQHIADRLAAALGEDPQLGIVQGLAVGERQRVTPEQWRVFAATGTSHLMAISGLHIAMVAALSAALGAGLVRLPGMQRRRFTAIDGQAVGGILGALVYAGLAGFEIPAQRTLAMLSIWWGARLSRRQLRPAQGLALSLIAVMLVDPFAPLSIGAWLSFGAVAAILWLLNGSLRTAGTGLRFKAREFLRIQTAVTVGLLPLLVLAFGAVSVTSPLVNLVAIPFFTLLLVPLVLAGTALLLLWPAGGAVVLHFATSLLDLAWPLLAMSARVSHGVWYPAAGPAWTVALLVLGAAIAIAPGFSATRLLGLLLCLPGLFWRPAPLDAGEFRLTVLDVGQGLAAVVQTRSRVLLYDAGPAFQSGRDTGEMVVLPFLRSLGVRRLDAVVASHGDADHAGGLRSVLAGMPVARLFASASVTTVAATPCQRGARWQWDGVEFSFLHPDSKATWRSDNETSCVLRIAATGGSALLPGDIERGSEAELVAAGLIEPTDIVIAAHHGSRTSSTAAFVAALDAKYVVYAAGYRNRWGFPRPDVVARWEKGGASGDTTADAGAISVRVAASGITSPERYRESRRRYWRVPATIRPGQEYPALR